jgi:hypothetical protein
MPPCPLCETSVPETVCHGSVGPKKSHPAEEQTH